MPKITAQGKTIDCESGANLRQVLLDKGVDLYNGAASVINCHGLGTCGTCTVAILGTVSEMDWREKARLSVFPHSVARGRRLACQVQVLDDIQVTKFDEFWGQGNQKSWTP